MMYASPSLRVPRQRASSEPTGASALAVPSNPVAFPDRYADMVVDLVSRRWLTKQHEMMQEQLLLKTKEQLLLNRELVSLLDTANAPIFAVDTNLCVTSWNRKVSLLASIKPHEIFGRPIASLYDQSREVTAKAAAQHAASAALMTDALTRAAVHGERVEGFLIDFVTEVRHNQPASDQHLFPEPDHPTHARDIRPPHQAPAHPVHSGLQRLDVWHASRRQLAALPAHHAALPNARRVASRSCCRCLPSPSWTAAAAW
jgi:hypothetical protein